MPSRFELYPEEVAMFDEFVENHSCESTIREAMIEEDCSPVLYSIELSLSGIGTNVFAKCNICGSTKVIMCDRRFDAL